MSALSVEFPEDVRSEIARRAGNDPAQESAWVIAAVRDKLAACAQRDYLEERARRATPGDFREVLSKVKPNPPMPGDEWPPIDPGK